MPHTLERLRLANVCEEHETENENLLAVVFLPFFFPRSLLPSFYAEKGGSGAAVCRSGEKQLCENHFFRTVLTPSLLFLFLLSLSSSSTSELL